MFSEAVRERLRLPLLCASSSVIWEGVSAWMVVAMPCWMGATSFNAFANGARPTISSESVRMDSFIPYTMVGTSLPAAAEMSTFFAPASMCACAFAREQYAPLHSSTTSISSSHQGSAEASASRNALTTLSPIMRTLAFSSKDTLVPKAPYSVLCASK